MLGIGGFSPLDGFMSYADWKGVCRDYRTAAGIFWPIPITLSVDADTAEAIRYGDSIALTDPESGEPLATMSVAEKYTIDKALECQSVFRTTEQEHPGVRMVMQQGDVNLAGPIKVLSDGGFKAKYGALFMTPAETRAEFARLGWSRIAAFQTRNPMHRSHEYLAKVAIEVCDGVLVHSLLGNLKPGDIPADVRTKAIAVLIEKWDETPTLTRIFATIYVEKEGQKGIIIGAGGARLKQVGTLAREEMERFFGKKIFLDLHLKVRPDWREKPAFLDALDEVAKRRRQRESDVPDRPVDCSRDGVAAWIAHNHLLADSVFHPTSAITHDSLR